MDRQYRTRQRELILEYLIQNSNRHICADDIVAHLKQRGTAVGKSTVYRYLDKLVEQNAVRKYVWEEGKSACYQYAPPNNACTHHFHLKCTACGQLLHMECSWLNEVAEHVSQEHQFKIDQSKTVLYGLCSQCRPSKEEIQ